MKARNFNFRKNLIFLITILFFIFQMYIAFIKSLPPLIQNPLHLILALATAFLWFPFIVNDKKENNKKLKYLSNLVDTIVLTSLIFSMYYFLLNEETLSNRIQYLDPLTNTDYLVMFIIVISLLEAVRRVLGLNLLVFIGIFLAYGWFGEYFPHPFNHSGINLAEFTDLMIMGSDGIFGSPLNASVNILYYFILFGGFLAACGGGQVLMDMGMKIGGKNSGGPAQASILSSALLGMINGSAMANVTTTGVMTIPLMKRAGFKPEQAGAVEAAASTSGQIMPPIMGVGAFVMAEMTGIPYREIALAAIVPALGYIGSLFILVYFIAKRESVIAKSDIEKETIIEPIMKRLYLLIPVLIVVYNIIVGTTLMTAALYGIGAVLIINILRFKNRILLRELFDVFVDSTKQVAQVAVPTAAAGIIIGIVVISGLASRFAGLIDNVGYLWLALLITAAGSILLGMALPTVAAYLASYILFLPALIELGIPALPANLFIFYFGIVAQITPPVALASYAAAGIAKADPWKTGITAFRYALVAFLVPFVFVYRPEILFLGTPLEIGFASIVLIFGTFLLVAGISGYLFGVIEDKTGRLVLIMTSILIILPSNITLIIGGILGVLLIAYYFLKNYNLKVI